MNDIIQEWGLKLLITKLKIVGSPLEFFRQHQIYKWNLQEQVTHCLKIYKDVLWMRLLEQSEGIKMPNGCRFFAYVPFFSKVKNYYRFRNLVPRSESDILDYDQFLKSRPWEYHTFIKSSEE